MKTKHKVSALVLSLIFILGCFTACLTEAFQAFNDGGIESFAESLYPLTEEEVEEFSPKNQQQASYIDNAALKSRCRSIGIVKLFKSVFFVSVNTPD